MKLLVAVFLPASPFIPTSPFINFGDFCQSPRLVFWPKFASLPVYSALPFYLKLESIWIQVIGFRVFSKLGGNSPLMLSSTSSGIFLLFFIIELAFSSFSFLFLIKIKFPHRILTNQK